jgi:hypothetical protein
MNKMYTYVIGAVVLLAFAGGYYYTTLGTAGEVETDFGNLEVVVEFGTADGQTIEVTKDLKKSLTVESPDGVVVTSVTARLKASFSTSTETFENIEFELAPETYPPNDYTPGTDPITDARLIMHIYEDSHGTQHLYRETYAEQHSFTHSDYDTPVYLLGDVIFFEDVFDNTHESGAYQFAFEFEGDILYRGGSELKGWSDWEHVELSSHDLDGSTFFSYTGPDVEIGWESEVIWS